MKKESLPPNRRQVITASEIGEFTYCAKAWYLKRCGEQPQSPHLEEGRIFHAEHQAGVSQAARLMSISKMLALIVLVLLIVLILIWSAAEVLK